MNTTPPIVFVYHDGVMVPRSRAQADKWYGDGEVVALERFEQRSISSHNHEFAVLASAWENLPSEFYADYPTPEHFRKRLLIEAGYCTVEKIVFSTAQDAIKAAALAMAVDDYNVATADGRTFTRYIAKSQSMKAMGKKDFQASKQAVLELAAAKIGVSARSLSATEAA
jgi:hypothetical protein